MHEGARDVIDLEGTADATLLPPGAEHKMLDDQLAAPVEKVSERFLTLRAVENIVLFKLDPRQFAPLRAQLVAQSRELFLLRQMRLARSQPLVPTHDPMVP